MPTSPFIDVAVKEFEKALHHLQEEFSRLQAGRANPALVEPIMVDAYGTLQPIKNVANISVPDAKTLQIQPWDRSVMPAIEKAIQQSDLGLNPVNNGVTLLLVIPQLTEERRRDLVKIVNRLAEEARISIRNGRQTAHAKFKQMQQEKQITEDEAKGGEKRLQDKVDHYNNQVADLVKAKEASILTV